MKKLILTAMAVAGLSVGAYAQGTVAFQNYTTGSVLGVMTSNGPTLYSGAVHVELFWGPLGDTAAQLLALDTGLVFNTTITAAAAGHFSDSTVAITSGPLGAGSTDANSVELLIAAWVGGTGTDYNNAVANGATMTGITAAFGNPTGGGGSPAASPANMVNWTFANSLNVVTTPEPATLVIGGLGAAGLLLFRRRR